MMLSKDSIFYCLYRGGVSPTESNRRPLTGEYKKLLDKADDLQTKVQSLLTDEGKQLLEELQKVDGQIGSTFEEEKFKEGFILGARLMIETLTDKTFIIE